MVTLRQIVLLCVLAVCGSAALADTAFACSDAHAESFSGQGSSAGTWGTTSTWSGWYSTNPGFSNEASWIGNPANGYSSSIEGGFYTGSGANGTWTQGIVPYWTINNGNSEHDFLNNPLDAGMPISINVMSAAGSQPSALVMTDGQYGTQTFTVNGGGMSVPTPRQNFAQGEAWTCSGPPDSTMGGGSAGSTLQMTYELGATGTFYDWGFQNLLKPPAPYSASTSGNYTWSNRGGG